MDCRIRFCPATQTWDIADSRTNEHDDLGIHPTNPRAFQGPIQIAMRMSDLSDSADNTR